MEDALCKELEKRFLCRSDLIKTLTELIADAAQAYPNAIYLYGHSGTGKTAIIKEFLRLAQRLQVATLKYVHLNCIECYTSKILLENILEELVTKTSDKKKHAAADSKKATRCENLKDFVETLRQQRAQTQRTAQGFIIVFDNAERLRDMDANLLPAMLRLRELTGLNICALLISQLPFEKYYCKTGLSEIITLHCAQYSKAETLSILSADLADVQRILRGQIKRSVMKAAAETATDLEEHAAVSLERKLQLIDAITPDFFNNYLNLFLSVFYKACRDVPELKFTAFKCFSIYMQPVFAGSIDVNDVTRLWRHISGALRQALTEIYMRLEQHQQKKAAIVAESAAALPVSARQWAQSLELPYFAKYLLIAGFLASYNSPKDDKRLYVKHHGKQRKRMQTVNAKAKVTEKLTTSIGPKSFSIDRLLAIFYAILDEKVGLTCNLLSQISTLVHLKLLSFVSGESNIMDGGARLQCTVSLEFVACIGRVVGFNVRQYLCDFH